MTWWRATAGGFLFGIPPALHHGGVVDRLAGHSADDGGCDRSHFTGGFYPHPDCWVPPATRHYSCGRPGRYLQCHCRWAVERSFDAGVAAGNYLANPTARKPWAKSSSRGCPLPWGAGLANQFLTASDNGNVPSESNGFSASKALNRFFPANNLNETLADIGATLVGGVNYRL